MAHASRSPVMKPLVVMALETAMRRSELLAIRWDDVNFETRTARLHDSKNNEARAVPLSTRAVQTLIKMGPQTGAPVFPINHPSVSKAFEQARERAGLPDLRFHDLRHTAITRIALKVPNLIELSAISGHKSVVMLKRYYHPRAEDLAKKLG